MPNLPKTYDPQSVEAPIYQRWLKSGFFNPDKLPKSKRRKPFSISMPPVNVTGELHLGHSLFLTTQDILIRWKRMAGFATLWLPGTDHAGIATQILVERALKENGISRYEIGREKFLKHVWAWKERYGERIVNQVKRMGASCDWSREHFTMDPALTRAVQAAFLKLYNDGLIYRGERVIHWCVEDQTGISDLEVDHREEQGTLWFVKYPLTDGRGHVTVATTRPETMLGDTAVAVHPDDRRYQTLVGKTVRLPIASREIPIIADQAVDKDFGTGAVKVTPAHDAADFEIAQRHQLRALSVIGTHGAMTRAAGQDFEGLPVSQARDLVVQMLKEGGWLERHEPYSHNLAYCSRSNTPIEPLLSKQWFVKTKPLAAKALAAIKAKKTAIVPDRFTKVLIRWLENIRDWNISRQLWWGHRIPIWYCVACDTPIASIKEPRTKCKRCGDNAYRQDEDSLDTWFSSGLWTFSTLGWPEKAKDLKRFHPTSLLGTAWDILFFWVARMMMFSLYFLKAVPFRTVYLHGLVLDEHGRKMSKSKGTGVDPLVMIDRYGTDALRLSLVIGVSSGLDFRMSEAKIAGQRNFCNKLWNVSRYVLAQPPPSARGGADAKRRGGGSTLADKWILARLNNVTGEVTQHLEKYQFGLAVEALQQFIWNDFADWYVEIHKVEKNTAVLRHVLQQSLILLHPFAPFVTEAIWSALGEKQLLMIESWPKTRKATAGNRTLIVKFKNFQRLVAGLRNMKLHGNDNKPLVVEWSQGADKNLISRLSGIEFGEVRQDKFKVTIANNTFLITDVRVADAFSDWRARQSAELHSYIFHKEKLANNNKAPAQVREQARIDLTQAKERLAEL